MLFASMMSTYESSDCGLPLGMADRPRERLFLLGSASVSDVDLAALILGGGKARARAMHLLHEVGGLSGLARMSPHELMAFHGIKLAGASALAAAVELSRRLPLAKLQQSAALHTATEVAGFIRSHLLGATQEHFVVVGLDARQRVKLVRTVAIGSLAQVDVHPRELFRPLVHAGAHSCVLAHNHPSGDPSPSAADLQLTRRMGEVGKLMGIPVLDHLIVAQDRAISLASLGILEEADED